MGRGRLAMKLIEKEKSRKATFHKRKNGIMKKAHELSTLCGVDTCVILYSPYFNNDQFEIWPQDPTEVHRIIGRYEASIAEKGPKNYSVSEFFKDRKNKVEAEASKLHKERLKMLYPTWDERFDVLGEEELRRFVGGLDAKIEDCKQRINMLKKKHYLEEKQLESDVNVSNRSHLCFLQNTSTSQTLELSRTHQMMQSFDPDLMHLMMTQNDDNGNNNNPIVGALGYDARDGGAGNYMSESSSSSSPCNYFHSNCYGSLQKFASQNNNVMMMQCHHHEPNLPLMMMQEFQTNYGYHHDLLQPHQMFKK